MMDMTPWWRAAVRLGSTGRLTWNSRGHRSDDVAHRVAGRQLTEGSITDRAQPGGAVEGGDLGWGQPEQPGRGEQPGGQRGEGPSGRVRHLRSGGRHEILEAPQRR